jgi:hypothetical protein
VLGGIRLDPSPARCLLETREGAPADPPTLTSAVPNWSSGDTIPLGAGRALRVVDVGDDGDQPPVLVVEDMAG